MKCTWQPQNFDETHYSLDNKQVWTELKPVVVDGPAWSFVKAFKGFKNGQAAALALRSKNEVKNSVMIQKQKAYTVLSVLSFQGPRKHFTFQHNIVAHEKAHNELDTCKDLRPRGSRISWKCGRNFQSDDIEWAS
jgi:hypothetical protein